MFSYRKKFSKKADKEMANQSSHKKVVKMLLVSSFD